jgi:hypothetical protein
LCRPHAPLMSSRSLGFSPLLPPPPAHHHPTTPPRPALAMSPTQRFHRLFPDNETYVWEMERSIINVGLAALGQPGSGGQGPNGTGMCACVCVLSVAEWCECCHCRVLLCRCCLNGKGMGRACTFALVWCRLVDCSSLPPLPHSPSSPPPLAPAPPLFPPSPLRRHSILCEPARVEAEPVHARQLLRGPGHAAVWQPAQLPVHPPSRLTCVAGTPLPCSPPPPTSLHLDDCAAYNVSPAVPPCFPVGEGVCARVL